LKRSIARTTAQRWKKEVRQQWQELSWLQDVLALAQALPREEQPLSPEQQHLLDLLPPGDVREVGGRMLRGVQDDRQLAEHLRRLTGKRYLLSQVRHLRESVQGTWEQHDLMREK
jgi:hypothetical protein